MHRIRPALRSVVLGAAAAAIYVATIQAQSSLGAPSAANHFLATPRGWVTTRYVSGFSVMVT